MTASGSLSPLAGFLADRLSRSGVIIVSLLAWSAITWLTGHSTSFNQLLAARALMGVSEACYIPAALAVIVDYHKGPTRSLATGVHLTGVMVGSALGGLGGLFAEHHTWSLPFTIFGIIGILYSGFLALFLRDPVSSSTGTGHVKFMEALRSLFSRGSFVLIVVFWGLIGLAGWAIVGWMPTYLGEHFNLTQGAAGLSATGYLQAAALVGLLAGGAWADRWSRTTERGRIFVAIIGLCLAAPAVFLMAKTTMLPVAIVGLTLYGLTRSFTDANVMPILCLVSDARYRATGYGILNLFACLVGGLSIYLGGTLRDANFNLTILFQLAVVSLLICAVLLFAVKPATGKDQCDTKSLS